MAPKKKSARRSVTKKPSVKRLAHPARSARPARPARPAARDSAKAAAGPVRRRLVEAFQREHERTRKVLRALPLDHAEMRPHPRTKSTRELAFMFVMEQGLLTRMLTTGQGFGPGGLPTLPDRLTDVIDQFERGTGEVIAMFEQLPDSAFDETIKFPTGPGPSGPTIGDWTKQAFAWFMLADQIHHRGQMSVYLRMAGGRVPSIYGPSSDEPWR